MAARRRLVLHVDVNETIMIGDPIAGHDFQESLNNVIAKVAIVKSSGDGYVWHDGSPIDPALREPGSEAPPLLNDFHLPEGHSPYFKSFRRHENWPASQFTDPGMPGEIYRPLFEEMHSLLRWPHEPNQEFAPHGHHFLLPSFFRALCELERQGRDFSVVVRTYGTDLPEIAKAISAFGAGLHPGFPEAGSGGFQLDDADARWMVRRADRENVNCPISLCQYRDVASDGWGKDLRKSEAPPAMREVEPEEEILKLFAEKKVIGVRDDYHFWKGHGYLPQAGKPCWLVPDSGEHHIFLDDNIHDDPEDSIVSVRARSSADGEFACLSGEATRQLEGVILVKARPVDAALDEDYFLRQIERCEDKYGKMLESGALQAMVTDCVVTSTPKPEEEEEQEEQEEE